MPAFDRHKKVGAMKIITLLLLALVAVGCNKEKQADSTESTRSDTLQVPNAKYLSEQQLQDQVDQEIRNTLSLANDERIVDAVKIIAYTEEAIKHILDSNYTEATAKLEDAIGKAAVMTAARPDLSFFPLDVQITTRDLIADIDALKEIRKEADHLTDKGYLQAARHLLKDLASELEITTPMLPVATYPNALSMAAKALSDNKPDEALIILNTALSTVFVETKYVPLPLIRAERILEEVSALLEEEDRDTDINTLLENAEYQIRFAEALGYGKKDKEFEELYSAIEEIKQELKKAGDGDSAGLTGKLRDKLNNFKERISNSTEEVNKEENK
jgi:hypothetical protein